MFVMFASFHRRLAEEIDAEIERLELLGWDFDAVTRDDFAELVKAGDRLTTASRGFQISRGRRMQYRVIYADPPWPFTTRKSEGRR